MMNSIRGYLVAILAVTWATILPLAIRAQEASELTRLYNQGVNAYFAGRSSEAESSLSRALALESEDPRLYYFRALSLLRLGRLDEARGDMSVGASVEARRPQRFAIGKTLERVQGSHRLMLERYRREARSQTAINPTYGQQPARRRPLPTSMGDETVLRQRIVIPLDRLGGTGIPQPLTAEELLRRAQQAGDTLGASPQPTRQSAGQQSTGEDPFRDDPSRLAPQGNGTQAPSAQEAANPLTPEAEETQEAEATPEVEDVPAANDDPFGDL
jgi:Tetratricopeptide repeat